MDEDEAAAFKAKMDEQFPPASMTQDEWEEKFASMKPESILELTEAIAMLIAGPPGGHDYNTSGISMSIASQLAFNFVAGQVGASGFQAGYAALHAYGKTMGIKGPFGIIKAEDLLYPQYDVLNKVDLWIEEWEQTWAKEEARKKLAENSFASDAVRAHWEQLAE